MCSTLITLVGWCSPHHPIGVGCSALTSTPSPLTSQFCRQVGGILIAIPERSGVQMYTLSTGACRPWSSSYQPISPKYSISRRPARVSYWFVYLPAWLALRISKVSMSNRNSYSRILALTFLAMTLIRFGSIIIRSTCSVVWRLCGWRCTNTSAYDGCQRTQSASQVSWV